MNIFTNIFSRRISRVNLRFKLRPMNVSSSDEAIDDAESLNLRKKIRKRRKLRAGLTKSQIQNIEAISDGDSDEAVDINDSDCSGSRIQTAILSHHLHSKPTDTPYITSMNDSQMIGMLSGGENDGSYSSPLSQKSGKNMADFDDDDSPCEEELAQLAATSHCLNAFAQSQHGLNVTEHLQGAAPLNRLTSGGKKPIITSVQSASPAVKLPQQQMSIDEITQPSNFLLWDLLMDDKIVSFSFNIGIGSIMNVLVLFLTLLRDNWANR